MYNLIVYAIAHCHYKSYLCFCKEFLRLCKLIWIWIVAILIIVLISKKYTVLNINVNNSTFESCDSRWMTSPMSLSWTNIEISRPTGLYLFSSLHCSTAYCRRTIPMYIDKWNMCVNALAHGSAMTSLQSGSIIGCRSGVPDVPDGGGGGPWVPPPTGQSGSQLGNSPAGPGYGGEG